MKINERSLSRLAVVAFGPIRSGEQRFGEDARALANPLLDDVGDLRVVLEELARIFAALAETLAVEGEPGARLLDDAGLDAQVEQLAGLGNALAVHDVELDLAER